MDLNKLENTAKEKIKKMLAALKEAQEQAEALGFRIEVIDESTNKPVSNVPQIPAAKQTQTDSNYGSLSRIIKEIIMENAGEFTVPMVKTAIENKYPGMKPKQASIYNNLLRRVKNNEIARTKQGGKGDPSTFKKQG